MFGSNMQDNDAARENFLVYINENEEQPRGFAKSFQREIP